MGKKKYYKISVVTPSLNQANFIEKCIQSVLKQNYPFFEHIIIDGLSSDSTIEILKKYPHLKWISEKDNGQTDAINKGLRIAKGEIITYLNSDDIYFPGTFKKINKYFHENPDVDVIYGNGVWIDENDKIIHKRMNLPFDYKTWFYGMADPFQPEVFYRRRVLEKAGFLDESFFMMMDREWWIRMANSGCKFLYINDEFAALRKYGETKTAKFQKINNAERWRLHDKYWKGFRFSNMRLHKIHWKILNYYYRAKRQLRSVLYHKIKIS